MTPGGFTPDPRWPRWTPGRGAGGRWKAEPDDFEVEELPLVPPTGAGEHLWLWVEKVGRSTEEVAHALAASAGVSPVEVGYAGLKDREARTRQAFTVPTRRDELDPGPGARVLDRSRTARRLRVGQLRGNRFALLIRGGDPVIAAERAARVARTGMPNFYGAQRVGGDAPRRGWEALAGRGAPAGHTTLKFVLSAFQATLFNEVLRARGSRRLEGDLVLDELAPDATDSDVGRRLRPARPDERAAPTGPMFGATMPWPRGEARALEERVLRGADLPPGAWTRFPRLTQGTRRAAWARVTPEIEAATGGFWARFALPAGSYATVLLEEIL